MAQITIYKDKYGFITVLGDPLGPITRDLTKVVGVEHEDHRMAIDMAKKECIRLGIPIERVLSDLIR